MNNKAESTVKKIKDSFLKLYAEMSLDKINVKMLTQLACINRGTFYLHYFNLDDLITSIEDEQLKAINTFNNQYRNYYYSKSTEDFAQFLIPTFKYIEKNKIIFKAILGPNSRARFRIKFQELMNKNISMRFKSLLSSNNDIELFKKRSVVEFTISGSVGSIIHWINSDVDLPPEEFANLIAYMVLNGCFSCIEEATKITLPFKIFK